MFFKPKMFFNPKMFFGPKFFSGPKRNFNERFSLNGENGASKLKAFQPPLTKTINALDFAK